MLQICEKWQFDLVHIKAYTKFDQILSKWVEASIKGQNSVTNEQKNDR